MTDKLEHDLTEKQVEMLQGAADGLTNKEIAAQRGTSEQVIKNYFREVFAKLGAVNRSHAVAIGVRRYIID